LGKKTWILTEFTVLTGRWKCTFSLGHDSEFV